MTIAPRYWLSLVFLGCVGAFLFGVWWFSREEENYSRIEDGLYLGGDVASPPRGTGAVLNLCETADPYRCPVHIWEPIADSEPAPDIDWLRRMVAFIDDNRRAGVTVFVHCRNGVSRSGMVVVAYEMFKNRWGRDEALAFVRSKRPEVRPNPAFMRRLLEWEDVLKGRSSEVRGARFARRGASVPGAGWRSRSTTPSR
jgi:hypothetical protein